MTEPLHPEIVVKSRQSWQMMAPKVFRDDVEKALRTNSFDSVADRFMKDSELAKENLFELTEIAKKYVTVVGKLPKPPKPRNSSAMPGSTWSRLTPNGDEGATAGDLDAMIRQSRKDRGAPPVSSDHPAPIQAFSPPNAKDLVGAAQAESPNNLEEAISSLPAEAQAPFRLHTELVNDAHPFIRVDDKSTLAIFFNLSTSQIGTRSTSSGSSKTEFRDRGPRNPSARSTWNESTTTRPDFLTVRNWFVAFVDSEHLICLTTNGAHNHDGTSEITERIVVPRSEIHSIQWGYQDKWETSMASANKLLGWFKTHQHARQMIEFVSRQPWSLERVLNININFGEARIASPMLDAAEQLAVSLRSDTPTDSTAGYA